MQMVPSTLFLAAATAALPAKVRDWWRVAATRPLLLVSPLSLFGVILPIRVLEAKSSAFLSSPPSLHLQVRSEERVYSILVKAARCADGCCRHWRERV